MTTLAITLCILCQLFLVAGQLLLKKAMTPQSPQPWTKTATNLSPGIACMTLWFFLWLGLLESWDLSKIFPFEGLNPALIVIGAALFLKEKITPKAWLGITLISAGIILVSMS